MGTVGDGAGQRRRRDFFASLHELLDRHHWPTRAGHTRAIFSWIETFHHPTRRHSTLGYLSPGRLRDRCHDVITTPTPSVIRGPLHARSAACTRRSDHGPRVAEAAHRVVADRRRRRGLRDRRSRARARRARAVRTARRPTGGGFESTERGHSPDGASGSYDDSGDHRRPAGCACSRRAAVTSRCDPRPGTDNVGRRPAGRWSAGSPIRHGRGRHRVENGSPAVGGTLPRPSCDSKHALDVVSAGSGWERGRSCPTRQTF